jgi:nucleoside-diphosphate-sugar epimerase
MTVMITGGIGMIGAAVARELLKRGERPVLFDIAPKPDYVADIREKSKLFRGI